MNSPIAITSGDPAGIGPDIIIQALYENVHDDIVVIGDPDILNARAKILNSPLLFREAPKNTDEIRTISIPCPSPVTPGVLDFRNSGYVLNTIKTATEGCLQGRFSAIVTAPIHKAVINDAGIKFSGHTEYLAELTDSPLPVMMLATKSMRVALATTHLPISEVSKAITPELLIQVLTILNEDLKNKYGIESPHILVCGLNPHAGENGHMGMEEIETIIPVVEQLKSQGMKLTGPLPADTLFTPKYLDTADAVLSMFHDQGLPVLKYSGFGEAINVTLGLPIIRTSVDHGTALDLAGTGKSNPNSLLAAIQAARAMLKQ